MWWYIVQLIAIILTVFSVNEEYYGTSAFRKYESTVSRENKLYHRWGAAFITAMFLAFPILLYNSSLSANWLDALLLFVVNLVGWYWLLFDILYAKRIGQKWSYLGGSADSDVALVKLLGVNAGKIKAIFCLILIAAINIVHEIL